MSHTFDQKSRKITANLCGTQKCGMAVICGVFGSVEVRFSLYNILAEKIVLVDFRGLEKITLVKNWGVPTPSIPSIHLGAGGVPGDPNTPTHLCGVGWSAG